MILPKEFFEESVENLFRKSTIKSQILYTTTLLFIVFIISSFPFIDIDVTSIANGVVAPASERVSIISPKNGLVDQILISENKDVEEGDLLLAFQIGAIDQQIERNKLEQNQLKDLTKDIKHALKSLKKENLSINLSTPLYKSEWSSFMQERNDIKHQVNNSEMKHARAKVLFEKEVISKSEFEQIAFELESTYQRLSLLKGNRLNQWENELFIKEQQLEELITNEVQLLQERKTFYIRAPISGTLQNTIGVSKNSIVYTNQVLAEISPDTSLIAELFVTPTDIGLLKEGMPVRFQVNAFNYNDWGFLNGNISKIPDDALVTESGEIVFIVRCNFSRTELFLPNGYSASLKKGMTLNGRFILARRSLFQLLYDNVDDWLNPNRSEVVN